VKEERTNLRTLRASSEQSSRRSNTSRNLNKVSSAVLAANNHYTLDETVLEMVVNKHNEEEATKKAIEERKKATELKRAETLKKAIIYSKQENCIVQTEVS
jgi:hypothetical protein